jgi:hypothetical protein
MASSDNYSPLEKRLQFGALVAALAAIPVVYIQSSKNHDLLIIAEVVGVAIWLFFCFEVAILTWLAEHKRQWLLGHKLEVVIVLASSPVTLLINEGDNVLTASPLLIIPRLLKISKVAKLVKIGKVTKTGKIIRKSSAISSWFEVLAMNAAVLLIVGIAGMLVGKKAYSPRDGLRNWGSLLAEWVGLPVALGQVLIVATAVLATTVVVRRQNLRDDQPAG